MSTEIYRQASCSPEARVDDLLARMSMDEKLAQLGCVWVTSLLTDDAFDPRRARALIPHGIGEVTRVGASTGLRPDESAALVNQVQLYATQGTRLGIPVIVHEECIGGYCARDATVFPQAIGLASTWDQALVQEVAEVIRAQMLAVGARHGLGPVLDIARDPRWGRVEETFGEDPYLVGALGTAFVRGLQGPDLRVGVIATGKHFLAHGLPEGGKNHSPVQVGERELREVYAEPFAAAIRDAGLAAVMNSYSAVDALPCAGSERILNALLREELGFSGFTVADYYAIGLLVSHHRTAAGRREAAAQALRAGLDMELPAVDCYGEPLRRAVEDGEVPAELVDRSVRRVLEVKFRLGLFEQPYSNDAGPARLFDTDAQRALARRAATKSVVLLTNDGLLPLSPSLERLAVIGPGADDVRLLQGDYHYPTHQELLYLGGGDANVAAGTTGLPGIELLPEGGGAFQPGPYYTKHVTPLEAIRGLVGAGTQVLYAPGCSVEADGPCDLALAASVAREAEVAVVVVAGRSGVHISATVGEARDASDLGLMGQQEALVEEVVKTGTPTCVVVLSGRVHTLGSIADKVGALVQAWPLGEEGGSALADVLFGEVCPSGHLPVSLPRSTGQLPVYGAYRTGGGKSMFYGDYTDSSPEPLFPFGHGLSYVDFGYAGLEVEAGTTDEPIVVKAQVSNLGTVTAEEVVQLYVTDLVAATVRPHRQLVGFCRVELPPFTERAITFRVHPSRLAYFDEQMRFITEPGEFCIGVGRSIADIRLEDKVAIAGEVRQWSQRDVVATEVTVIESTAQAGGARWCVRYL